MEDVIYLFERLEKTVGNKKKAARLCGLERKTTYGWKETREIRLKTKKKILAALIENLTEETLDFIVQRSVSASADVLRIYLSALYEKAMDENLTASEFLRLASKFDEIKQRYSGLVVEHLGIQVGNMLRNIPERARELGVSFKPSPTNIMKLTDLTILIPNLIKTISVVSPYTLGNEIAKTFNIPEEFVNSISTALYYSYDIPRRAIELTQMHAWISGEQIAAGTIEIHHLPPLPSTPEERAHEDVWHERATVVGGTA
jgi:hypothetical protein